MPNDESRLRFARGGFRDEREVGRRRLSLIDSDREGPVQQPDPYRGVARRQARESLAARRCCLSTSPTCPERAPARQVLKSTTQRVEIGARRHVLIEQPRSLGRQILRRADQLITNVRVHVVAAREAEIDDGRLAQRRAFIHNDVGRLEVAMQDAACMCRPQLCQNRSANRDRIGHAERPLPQP